MKTVKSKSDLNRMALTAGATVTGKSGSKFNSTKQQSKPVPRLEKNPDAKRIPKAPEPKPTGPDPGSRLVSESVQAAAKANVMMLAELKEQMQSFQAQSYEPITDWDFEFVRDDKGYLIRMLAHGTVPGKVIN